MAGRSRGGWSEGWQKTRMRVLVRDEFECQAQRLGLSAAACGETRLAELQVHHLQARQAGGSDMLENLVTLCRAHHEVVHPWMARQLSQRERARDYLQREL